MGSDRSHFPIFGVRLPVFKKGAFSKWRIAGKGQLDAGVRTSRSPSRAPSVTVITGRMPTLYDVLAVCSDSSRQRQILVGQRHKCQ